MKKHFADILVVGSGAGGGPVAFKLAHNGIQVTLLEKGEAWSRELNPEDELAEIHLERHRPSAEADPTVVKSVAGDLITNASRVGQAFYLTGGGTVRYTATSWRLRKQDFLKKSIYGSIDGANIVDWPLSYEELEPYYTEAEQVIGVSGKANTDPTEPARSAPYPMPPLKEDAFQQTLTRGAVKLGWKPFPIPVAIHSQQSNERGASQCMQCGFCSGFPCRFMAKSSMDVVLYPKLATKKNFKIQSLSYVTKIVFDKKSNLVSGVEYLNLRTGKADFIGCRVLILALSAIQTTRLLLNSDFPNTNGLLGKNLMFHLEAKLSAIFKEQKFHQQYYKKVGIHDFYLPGKTDSFRNHRSIQSGSKAPPIAFAASQKGFGIDFIKTMQRDFLRTQEVQCMVEDLPQLNNQVTLSQQHKDPWGIPAPQIQHNYHEHDRLAVMSAVEQARKLLEAAGGEQIQGPKEAPRNITDRYTWHLMGTARMGTDPEQSVVNKDGQAHKVKNLFISDGSVFPTSGGLNPTLTIQALSFRMADRLRDLMKEKKI